MGLRFILEGSNKWVILTTITSNFQDVFQLLDKVKNVLHKVKKIIGQLFLPISSLHHKLQISDDFERKFFPKKIQISVKNFCPEIIRNQNFIMELGYGDEKLLYNFFQFM